MSSLAERITLAIKQAGVKPAHVAKAAKVSRTTVGDWMHGRTQQIRGATLLLAADFLGVNPAWLGTGKGPMKETAVSKDPDLLELIGLWDQLTESVQNTISVIARTHAGEEGPENPSTKPLVSGEGRVRSGG